MPSLAARKIIRGFLVPGDADEFIRERRLQAVIDDFSDEEMVLNWEIAQAA